MDELTNRVLALLEPEGLDVEGQNWQQRKSVQTRLTILEAAIDCLERDGYSRATTQLIAETAGISRGAMLHHYATKQDLIAAVIDYTMFKRMEMFLAGIRALSDDERVDEMVGVEVYWNSLLSREFGAYLELMIAARTDPELARIFLPKAQRYNRAELEEVVQAFPEWEPLRERYALAMDYCVSSLQGMLLNREVWADEGRRTTLRRFVADTLAMVRAGTLPETP
jgi:AcrR family transcriptional regulator